MLLLKLSLSVKFADASRFATFYGHSNAHSLYSLDASPMHASRKRDFIYSIRNSHNYINRLTVCLLGFDTKEYH